MTRKQTRIQLRRLAVQLGDDGLRFLAHNVKGKPTLEMVRPRRSKLGIPLRGERIAVSGRTWVQAWNRMVATAHGNRDESSAA